MKNVLGVLIFLLTNCSVFSLFKIFPKGIAVKLNVKVNVNYYIPVKYVLRYLSYKKRETQCPCEKEAQCPCET